MDTYNDPVNTILNEVLSDLDGTISRLTGERAQGEPDAKTESKYFESQRRIYAKAQYNHLRGVPATWTGEAWLVPSSSRAEAIHRIARDGDVWQCSCEAGAAGKFCWHKGLVEAHQVAEERAAAAQSAPVPVPVIVPVPPVEEEPPHPALAFGSRLAAARAAHTTDWF